MFSQMGGFLENGRIYNPLNRSSSLVPLFVFLAIQISISYI